MTNEKLNMALYYPKDGDQLWCVFDCDDNKDLELQAAAEYARKHESECCCKHSERKCKAVLLYIFFDSRVK